jgi:hypothetical protein
MNGFEESMAEELRGWRLESGIFGKGHVTGEDLHLR